MVARCALDMKVDAGRLLWSEARGIASGGASCAPDTGLDDGREEVDGGIELPDIDADDVLEDGEMLSGLISASGDRLEGEILGLGMAEGFSLAGRLWAYDLKTSGVENGG